MLCSYNLADQGLHRHQHAAFRPQKVPAHGVQGVRLGLGAHPNAEALGLGAHQSVDGFGELSEIGPADEC
jgi:hypothetical protein